MSEDQEQGMIVPAQRRAVAYIRHSGKDGETFRSFRAQLAEIRKAAHEKGEEVVFVYTDEGGTDGSRPGFEALANGVKAGEANFDSVMVWKYSRLARRGTELSEFRAMLAERGIDLVSVREPVMDLDSPRAG